MPIAVCTPVRSVGDAINAMVTSPGAPSGDKAGKMMRWMVDSR